MKILIMQNEIILFINCDIEQQPNHLLASPYYYHMRDIPFVFRKKGRIPLSLLLYKNVRKGLVN